LRPLRVGARGSRADFDCCGGRREEGREKGAGAVVGEGVDEGCQEAQGEVYLALDGVDYGEVARYGVGAHEDEELAWFSDVFVGYVYVYVGGG
jgi:hypothetical protein